MGIVLFYSKGLAQPRARLQERLLMTILPRVEKRIRTLTQGLFTYPVLMAADISTLSEHMLCQLDLTSSNILKLLAISRLTFNANYGDVLTIPEAVIRKEVMTIPGIDGRKMSKSYNNVIPNLCTF